MLLRHTLPLPPEAVYPHLADMRCFVAAHPFLFAAEPRGGPGDWWCHERIKPLGIPVAFGYPVNVCTDDTTRVVTMRTRINALVHLTLHFRLQPDGAGTVVEEQVVIQAPQPIRWLFGRIVARAHSKLFAQLALGDSCIAV